MDMVYLMVNEKGQTEPVQLVNASGLPQLLDASDPLVARLNTGPGSGRPVRLPKEHNELVEAMELTEFHYYVDENNKVIPIPPGSIIQGEFEDEEEEDDNVNHDLQENDQSRNNLTQVSGEIAEAVGETELPAAKTNVNLEEEVVPCSGEEQELAGGSEPLEAEVAKTHPVQSYVDFGIQEHSSMSAMDGTGELGLENASETIFTQDEIELEEEVVSLQISEPELVTLKPSAKYSKRSSVFTGHHEPSSSIGRSADAGSVGELQAKSPLKKSKKKLIGGTAESQASAAEKVPLQPGKKIRSVEPYTSPSASETSVGDTGRPKRSVPRRSVLEMLHGEGKARKPHASSESDSELDGASVTQHSGKRRQSKGAEKKALAAEKPVKSPLLSKTECKTEAQLIFTSQGIQTFNADQKCDETLELNSVSSLTNANVQSPVVTARRGKGRAKKLVPENPRVVENLEKSSAVQKDLVSVGVVAVGERKDDGRQQVPCLVEKESSKHDVAVTSEIDVVSTGFEFSDSVLNLSVTKPNSSDSGKPSFIDVLKPDDREIKPEPSKVFASDVVDKAETNASPLQKPLKRGRGRPKSTGERKISGFDSPKNPEELGKRNAEREATVFKGIKEMENEAGAVTTPEYLPVIPEAVIECSKFDIGLRSEEITKNEDQVARPIAENLDKKEGNLTCFESSGLIHTEGKKSHPEVEEEFSSKNILKEECKSNRKDDTAKHTCDDSAASDNAICEDLSNKQSDERSNTKELMTEEHEGNTKELMTEEHEEHLVLDEAMEIESEVTPVDPVESNLCHATVDLENTVAHRDAWQLAKASETTVEAEMCYAQLENNSHLFEDQSVNLTDTRVELPKELPGDEILELGNDQASVDMDRNHEAALVDTEDVLCSEEKCHAPIEETDKEEEEEEDTNLGHQVQDEEDIQDFHGEMYCDHDSTGEPEATATLSCSDEVDLVGEEGSVDSTRATGQVTKSLLKHLQSAVELGKKKDMEQALKKFEDSVLRLDIKAALLVSADLEQLATKIRCRLTYQETGGDRKEFTTSQLAIAPEERIHRLVVAELMKLRALDQELDKRRSELMVARGQLNRSENDVKQREQRLERSQMLLDLEKEAFEEDMKKLLKEKESIRKERKFYAKLKENKKRKAETDTRLDTSSKKVCVADPVSIKERRPLFEEMTAIKEIKTLTDSLQAVDKGSSSDNQSSLQRQISVNADECEAKAPVQIDNQRLPDEMPVEKSCVKANSESEAKSSVLRSDVPLSPSGVSTVVKGKKELLRRFEADELNSPGDEQKLNKSLSPKPSEDDPKPNKSSSLKPTTDDLKPNKSSSLKPTMDDLKPNKSSSLKRTADDEKPNKSSLLKRTADEEKPNKSSLLKRTADEEKPNKSSSLKSTADEEKPNKSSSLKLTADEEKPNKSSSLKTNADDRKPNKTSSFKPTADEEKPNKSSSLKSTADEEKPNKSSSRKLAADEQKRRKSLSHKLTADEEKPNKSLHKTAKLETPSSSTFSSSVKKSGQASSKLNQNPTSSVECLLTQSDSVRNNKDILPIASSSKKTSSKSHSGKRPSHSDSECQNDLPSSSPVAKKQHMDNTDVQDSTESSKSGHKDGVKRLSIQADSSSKKRDYKQRKRIPAV